jgi:hypothetical protein
MQSLNKRQNAEGVAVCAALATTLLCVSAHAQVAAIPKYLQYTQNPVQSVFEATTLGFAYERKCKFLSPSTRDKFEDSLGQNIEIFRSYLVVIKITSSNEESVRYVKELVQGAVRFAEAEACDESARRSVYLGLDKSLRFVEIIEPELNKPVPK